MKTVEITKATRPLAYYARQVEQGAVLVLKNGKPVAILTPAKGLDAESIALANSPKFAQIIERSRARHEAEGGVGIDQVRQRLGVSGGRERRRSRPSGPNQHKND